MSSFNKFIPLCWIVSALVHLLPNMKKHKPYRVYFSLSGGKEFSAHLALNSSGNLLFIKTAWFENPARSAYFFAAPATELWKRDISNASERVFPGCFSDFFGADFHRKRGVLVRKNSLAPSQIVSSQRRATRSDVSFKTKQSECLVTVEL